MGDARFSSQRRHPLPERLRLELDIGAGRFRTCLMFGILQLTVYSGRYPNLHALYTLEVPATKIS